MMDHAEQRRNKYRRRFMDKITLPATPGIDCAVWNGATSQGGYGRFRLGRMGVIPAHRAGWLLFVGPIPDGMVLMHSCDNPICVSLHHLSIGTQKENRAGMFARGRYRNGILNGFHDDIVNAYEAGATIGDLALLYGVKHYAIQRVLKKNGAAMRPVGKHRP